MILHFQHHHNTCQEFSPLAYSTQYHHQSLIYYFTISYKSPMENIYLNPFQLAFITRHFVEFVFSWFQSHFTTKCFISRINQSEKQSKDFDTSIKTYKRVDEVLSPKDVETVLTRLGLHQVPGGRDIPPRMGENETLALFESRSPCLDEVKEAFDVFDENKDGFIEEWELQKVLCALGLDEGLKMEDFGRMIRVFDENGDERLDFEEFVKFMECSSL